MKTLLLTALALAFATPSFASEKESEIQSYSNYERGAEFGRSSAANDNHENTLTQYVRSNLSIVQSRVGTQWIVDQSSLKCVSQNIRGEEAGACIVTAVNSKSTDSAAMWAILVGEADENGGILIRKIEFLKQNN